MKKLIPFILGAIIVQTSCKNAQIDENEIMVRPVPAESAQDSIPTLGHEKAATSFVDNHIIVVIHQMDGYGQDTTLARAAGALLEKVVNSPEFETAVVNNSYKHDQGLSGREIFNRIVKAHEIDGPGGADGVIDLRLRTINLQQDGQHWMDNCDPNSHAGTIGIDGGGSGIAAVCPQWLRSTAEQNKVEWLAAHFMHEYMHILSFAHPNQKGKSVPYKIHYIVEDLGAK